MTRILTKHEYAEIVRVNVRTVERHLTAGKVKGAFKVGVQWRIPATALPACLVDDRMTRRELRRRVQSDLASIV